MRHRTLVPVLALIATTAHADSDEAARQKLMTQLAGDQVASFGPALAGVTVDDWAFDEAVLARIEPRGFVLRIEPSSGVTVAMTDQKTCDAFAKLLVAKWGKPQVAGAYWFTTKTGIRSRFAGCEWTTDRYETVENFVNRSSSSRFPTFLVGQPESALATEIRRYGDRPLWEHPPIETSIGRIRLSAETEHGKVTSVIARFPDDSVLSVLRAQLEKLYGKPVATTSSLRWATSPPITLVQGDHELWLVAGKTTR
jgi:hypothetical protein